MRALRLCVRLIFSALVQMPLPPPQKKIRPFWGRIISAVPPRFPHPGAGALGGPAKRPLPLNAGKTSRPTASFRRGAREGNAPAGLQVSFQPSTHSLLPDLEAGTSLRQCLYKNLLSRPGGLNLQNRGDFPKKFSSGVKAGHPGPGLLQRSWQVRQMPRHRGPQYRKGLSGPGSPRLC